LQILVFFPEAKSDGGSSGKVGVKQIKEYVEVMKRGEIRRAIMVVTDNLTPFAKSCLGEIASKGYLIEVFQVSLHSPSECLLSSLRFSCAVRFFIFPDQILLTPKRDVLHRAETVRQFRLRAKDLVEEVIDSGVLAFPHVAHLAF
jgi:hypothetical protein